MFACCASFAGLILLVATVDPFKTQSGIPQSAHAQKPPLVTNRDVVNVEAQTSSSGSNQASSIDHDQIDHGRIERLEALVRVINADLKELSETTRTTSELQTENAELRRMLSNFEYFFGSLYVEKPEAFDPELGVDKRMSALNQYLGNKEAELAGLRPSPASVIDGEEVVDAELFGKALTQLTQENQKLATKVAKLQEKVDVASTTKDSASDDVTIFAPRRKSRDVTSQNASNDTDQTADERLAAIEHMIVQGIERVRSNLSHSNKSGNISSEVTAYDDIVDDGMTVEDEIDRLAEDLLGIQNHSPSGRRKVAFSAARTSSLYGMNESHQVIEFDHIFVDKGRDFVNGTYVCEVTGFYYISFNLRSHDGYHLGVTLHRNDDVITAIYTDRSRRNVMESQSVIVRLERGDRVYLLLGPSDRYAMYSDIRNYCTLNIFLLYRGK